jgi:hypothetical protein
LEIAILLVGSAAEGLGFLFRQVRVLLLHFTQDAPFFEVFTEQGSQHCHKFCAIGFYFYDVTSDMVVAFVALASSELFIVLN